MKLAYSSNAYLNFSIEETIARIAALGYDGLELLADVPHAWPAGLLEERKQAIRKCLEQNRLAISNVNAFMMNAVADPRQPYWHPSWIEPDRHYRAIRREHTKRALRLAKELGAPSIQTEPGGPLVPGQSWQAAADVFYEEIMPCVAVGRAVGSVPVDRAGAGPDDREVRAVSGVCRPDRLALGGVELRHRPRVLRRRGSASGGSPGWPRTRNTTTSKTSPPRASTPIWFPAAGRLTFRPFCGKLPQAATRAGSPSSCIRTSTIPTERDARRKRFLERIIERKANDE